MNRIELIINKLSSKGDGIARHEGKVIFIPWAVPGDRVLVQIEKEKRDYSEGRLLEIISPSPDRAKPPCPYFYKCGGCQWQHLNYEAQLKWKREIVHEALGRIAGLRSVAVSEVIPSPKIWNYRSRIRLHSDRKGRLGFYGPESHQVVEIESCLIADERLNERLKRILQSSLPRPENSPSRDPVHASQKLDSCSASSARGRNDIGSMELRTDPGSTFTQVNPEQNENLIRLVCDMASVKKSDQILELYCGDGNLSLPLAEKSSGLIGVDKDSAALDEARKKTDQALLQNIRWICGDVTTVAKGLLQDKATCDVLVADPPRRGLEGIAEKVPQFEPRAIVYVSCNATTFARDAAILVKSGFELTRCQPIDMFPHTSHIELVGIFS